MEESPPVIIRRSVRHDVSMPAAFRVAPSQVGLVRFTAAAGAKDGWIGADVVDFSSGGLGLMTTSFLPRRSLIVVRLFGPDPEAAVLLEVPCRVQRIFMTDRRPAYLVGTSFEALTQEIADQISAVLAMLAGEGATGATGVPGA